VLSGSYPDRVESRRSGNIPRSRASQEGEQRLLTGDECTFATVSVAENTVEHSQ